ncbi:hypothetical protein FB446DRAFT_739353 [Lentinula raphanica]|nr:hypothetical protein FB446DRAFT_739353 [Lentinula raphanica]
MLSLLSPGMTPVIPSRPLATLFAALSAAPTAPSTTSSPVVTTPSRASVAPSRIPARLRRRPSVTSPMLSTILPAVLPTPLVTPSTVEPMLSRASPAPSTIPPTTLVAAPEAAERTPVASRRTSGAALTENVNATKRLMIVVQERMLGGACSNKSLLLEMKDERCRGL